MNRRSAVFAVLGLALLLNAGRFAGDAGRWIAQSVRQREALVPRLRSAPLVEQLTDGPLATLPVVVLSDGSLLAVWLRHALYPRRIVDVPTRNLEQLDRLLPARRCALIVDVEAAHADPGVLAAARARVVARLPDLDVVPVGAPSGGLQLFELRP